MANAPANQRWETPAEIFATKLSLEDNDIPRGWTKNSIVIQPGVRACAIVDGKFLGEIPAGEFTFHDFRDKLQFWRKGTATILLMRSEVVRLPVECNGFISADDIPIELRVEVGIKIDNPVAFMLNMMGPRKEYPVKELADRLTPAVKQEAWVATARLKASELRGPAVAAKVSQQIVDAIAPSFRRYGLSVFSIEGFSAQAAGMEKHWDKVKENNFEVAGERLTNQRMGEDVGIMTDRIAILEKLRDIVISDKFDQARTEEEKRDIEISDKFDEARSDEELKTLIAQVDKARLLRKEEIDQLTEGFNERRGDREAIRGDREAIRSHIVGVLDINRQQEVDQLRAQVGHSLEIAARKNELELADATNSVANLEWRNEIARGLEEAENGREERKKNLASKWERIREVQRQKQDGSWERLLHQQREESIRTELAIKEAERARRVGLLEAESVAQIESQRIIAERQRREFELEMGSRESTAQFDQLKRVQDMNFDGHARQVQLDSDLKAKAESLANTHELERLKTMGTLSAEALIASSNTDNAKVLAELKIQEAKSQAEIQAASRGDQQTFNEERLELYKKLSDVEKSKSDTIADVFQQALKGQQDAVAQMISGLATAHSPPRPLPVSASPPPVVGTAAEWHVASAGGQSGPHTAQQMRAMIQQGTVAVESLVWKAGMAEWIAIANCPELAGLISASPPPPPRF